MPLPSIGDVICRYVSGDEVPPTERVEFEERPGVPGQTMLLLGEGDGQFEFIAKQKGLLQDNRVWLADLLALVGKIVTIVDDTGASHPGCQVAGVRPVMFGRGNVAIWHSARIFPGDPTADTWSEARVFGKVIPNAGEV